MESSGTPISSELYAQAKGKSCPVCGSHELDRAPPSGSENGLIIVWIGCHVCRHVWLENYQLTGYSDLELTVQSVDMSPIVPNNDGRD
jgi:hypothetical protein